MQKQDAKISQFKRIRKRKAKKVTAHLPKLLVSSVKATVLSQKHANRALFLCATILDFSYYLNKTGYISIHSDLIKHIDSNYSRWLRDLKDKKIIICNEWYHYGEENPKDNFTKKYMINPALLGGETEEVEIEPIDIKRDFSDIEKYTMDCLHKLEIDTDLANSLVQEYITMGKFIHKLKFNEEITDTTVEVLLRGRNGKYKAYRYLTINALAKAKREGLSLIKDGNTAYIADKEEYLQQKKAEIERFAQNQIKKIKEHEFFAKRSQMNLRLDSNITQIPNYMIQSIKAEEEEIKWIDIKNSHHQIMAKMIGGLGYMCVKDFDASLADYCKAAKEGNLYELVAENLNYSSRDAAKLPMIKLMYYDHRAHCPEKTAMKAHMPGVVALFDNIKKSMCDRDGKNGNSNFAYAMQRAESVPIIDGIYEEMRQKGIWGLTKHDSVGVKESDLETVKLIVIKHLTAFFGNFAITVDGKKEVY